MDKERIIPGRNWKISIKNAIETSRYFIPLFSSVSVAKRGYIHALEVFDELPESEIFVIPARLDSCDIPYDKLKDVEYVDLFPSWEKGMRRIMQAISFASMHDRRYAQSLTVFSEELDKALEDRKISQGQLKSINTSMSELAKEVEDLKPGKEQEIDYIKHLRPLMLYKKY